MNGGRVLLGVLCLVVLMRGNVASAAAQSDAKARLLDFHSGFWVNLHHFLYRQAQFSESEKGVHDLSLTKADSEELQHLSASERDAWNQALSYYRQSVVRRDLLFDGELIRTKDELEDQKSSSDLAGANVPPELKSALLKAAPIYRKHWWERHNKENREWIRQVEPSIEHYGRKMNAELSRIYEEPWPQHPVRVDVVAYANWAGAYTTVEPTRPTIASADPANQGTAALEVVFHETSHGMMGKVMDAMHTAESTLNSHRSGAPFRSGSLWHAVLFYTTGELVAAQISGYTPYADKNGLWVRAWPPPYRSLIERDWKPHMKGSAGMQQSLTKLVYDLASAPH